MYNDWTLAFGQPLTRAGSDYWERCRGNRPMPAVKDLTVRAMKTFISNVALIDVEPRANGGWDFRIRLAGENTKRVFGDVTGKSFEEFLTPQGQHRWRFGAEAVCVRKTRLRNHGAVSFENKHWLDFETLLAPLGAGKDVETLFAVFVAWRRGAD